MRGLRYSSNDSLPEEDLEELVDLLAIQLHTRLGPRVYQLNRSDIADLVQPFVADLAAEDQQSIPWLIWHLFQEAREIEQEQQ